ncbi:TRAP transporter small permease [Glacieibacterium megasporae]|uniref:TRAP transporter small permease n=1 Tax=Glacieibacterium megasporae TaxID=2835787 RepID=UPI001C1E00C5|nr:TRAP transporter small permease [Polymorphobacter megasporae]UAJ11528.1 TRAP transporter small permease [Polymorphobacter megasporae]
MTPTDMDFDGDPMRVRVPGGRLRRIALATGSAALLIAMATDALAVAGRHLGVRFLGAIEIVEACVAVAATSAIVIATIDGTHARVRIVLEQVGERVATALERLADVCSAVIFLLLAAGSIWLASDLWQGHEVTEVLGLPLRWFRLFWIAGVLLAAVIFAVHARKLRR